METTSLDKKFPNWRDAGYAKTTGEASLTSAFIASRNEEVVISQSKRSRAKPPEAVTQYLINLSSMNKIRIQFHKVVKSH